MAADRTSSPVQRYSIRTLLALSLVTVGILLVPSASHAQPDSITEVQQEIQDLYHEAEFATEKFNDYRSRIQDAEKRLEITQQRIQIHQAKIDTLLAESGIFAAIAYQTGGVDATLQLLLAESPQQFLQRATVLDQLTKQQSDALRSVHAVRQELIAIKLQSAQDIIEIGELRKELAAERDLIQANLRKAQALLSSLEADQRNFLQNTGSLIVPDSVLANLPGGRAGTAIKFAIDQIGEPYVWGANGPSSWDCSSLTQKAWAAAGVSIPRVSWQQASVGTSVSKSNLRPGDLVFFYSPISHVAIYIGEGLMIHSPNPTTVVKVDSIDIMPWAGARRVG